MQYYPAVCLKLPVAIDKLEFPEVAGAIVRYTSVKPTIPIQTLDTDNAAPGIHTGPIMS
jgi:hypothetical protein